MISQVADVILRYNNHAERALFAVTQLGKQSTILGYTWLKEHNPEIDWQTKEVRMSRCPAKCATCRSEIKHEKRTEKIAATQIRACRLGRMPVLIEDYDEDDETDAHEGASSSEGGVPPSAEPQNAHDLPENPFG